MNIATGDLAAMPASREELEELNRVLHEQLTDAKSELNKWRAWGDRMPEPLVDMQGILGKKIGRICDWMRQRPEPTR
jgi:hypothetical protein